MNDDREKLEQVIGKALREQPLRRAPSAMESRVLAAIEARGATTFWTQGFAHWPVGARVAFIFFAVAMTKLTLMAGDWMLAIIRPDSLVAGAVSKVSWIKVLVDVVHSSVRSIPEHWLWAGFVIVAVVYGVLFMISAIAYRTLYASR